MSTPGTRAHERLLAQLRDRIRTHTSDEYAERMKREADERRSQSIARRMRSQKHLAAA